MFLFCFFYKQTDTVSCMVAKSRLYVTVSYGSCMVAASDLYSTVSYGRAVQTPSAVDDVRDGCNCTHKLCSAIRWVLYNLSSVVRKHMGKHSSALRYQNPFVAPLVG